MNNGIWDSFFFEKDWGRYPSESLIRFTARNFYSLTRSQVKILEIGCGPGPNIWYFSREGFDTYGIDSSGVAIEKAKQRLNNEGLAANLQVGDIVDLPYEDNFFDAVIDNVCLYNIDVLKTETILSGIKRVLKPKSLFYSQTFADDTYKGLDFKQIKDFEYIDASDGPFYGSGFFRLADKSTVEKLYGKYFTIKHCDKLQWYLNNEKITVSHWIVISQKEKSMTT